LRLPLSLHFGEESMPTLPPDPLYGRLSDAEAAKLLALASDLDALHRASASLADLQAAAHEAGISEQAFEAAVGELRRDASRPHRARWITAVLVAILLLAGGLTYRRLAPAPLPATTEEAFLLKCLPATDAADLVRPLVRDVWSTVVIDPTRSPRILTVRTTTPQLDRIRDLLRQHDGGAIPSCPLATPSRAL
jgi:hypothetical protein